MPKEPPIEKTQSAKSAQQDVRTAESNLGEEHEETGEETNDDVEGRHSRKNIYLLA